MEIKVYKSVKKSNENQVNPYGVVEVVTNEKVKYSTTLIHKADGLPHYYRVQFVGVKPIDENSIIDFDIPTSDTKNKVYEYLNKRTNRIEKAEDNVLFIRDYRVISVIEREPTKREDLPF